MESNPVNHTTNCATFSWPERMVRRLAGSLVLASLFLAWTWNPWWLALTTFVGLNLLQSSFTGFCPAETFFRYIETRRNRHAAAPSH